MAKASFNRNFDIGRVVKKLVYNVLALYVGGTIITTFGTVMNCTQSPFYSGLSLIGWTVGSITNATTQCATQSYTVGASNVILNTTGAGVLAVVGVIAIAGVVLEFIKF